MPERVRTDGSGRTFQIRINGVLVTLRAPGILIELAEPEPDGRRPAAAIASEAAGEIEEAIAANGLDRFLSLALGPVAASPATRSLQPPSAGGAGGGGAGSILLEVPAPGPGRDLIALVSNGDRFQACLPQPSGARLHAEGPRASLAPAGGRSEASDAGGGATRLRFLIPLHAVSRSAPGGKPPLPRAIRLLQFEIVPELVGAGAKVAARHIAHAVEGRFAPEGLRLFEPVREFPFLSPDDARSLGGGRILLLLHGLFSSVPRAFAGLCRGRGTMGKLRRFYGGRMVGYDHWTLAKSPLENAKDALRLLPDRADVDILCHSRGALVARAMLQHPALSALRAARLRSVGTVIHVAGANEGSALAEPRNWILLMNVFLGLALAAAAPPRCARRLDAASARRVEGDRPRHRGPSRAPGPGARSTRKAEPLPATAGRPRCRPAWADPIRPRQLRRGEKHPPAAVRLWRGCPLRGEGQRPRRPVRRGRPFRYGLRGATPARPAGLWDSGPGAGVGLAHEHLRAEQGAQRPGARAGAVRGPQTAPAPGLASPPAGRWQPTRRSEGATHPATRWSGRTVPLIRSGDMKDPCCVFCRVADSEADSSLVFEDEVSVAFLDRKPLFPGHCLVIPREHFETLPDLPADLVGPLFRSARLLARAVAQAMKADGSFVAVNNKISQSVPHLHVHVVPRRKGDGLKGFFWPRQGYGSAQDREAAREAIRNAVAALRAGESRGRL